MNSDKPLSEEARIIAEYNELFQPQPYRQVFADLGEWNFDRRYIEDFYETAKTCWGASLLNGCWT